MDRKEAVERIQEVMTIIRTQHMCKDMDGECTTEDRKTYIQRFEALRIAIEALQEPERKEGQWKDFDYDNSYSCTSCGEIWTLNDGTPEENNMNYCPNCGADMRGNKKLKQALAKELGCDSDEITRIIT